jgi:hypothetical protein
MDGPNGEILSDPTPQIVFLLSEFRQLTKVKVTHLQLSQSKAFNRESWLEPIWAPPLV